MACFPAEGIHFLDSGNYHYISVLWMEKIKEPFHLVLLDYHSDMQPPQFPELLSCGCWVKTALDQNPYLQNVWILGPDQSAFTKIEPCYQNRIIGVSLQQLEQQQEAVKNRLQWLLQGTVPLYLSLDKDVMNQSFARTNWSQGELSLSAVEHFLGPVLEQRRVIGMDICGECSSGLNLLEQLEDDAINNETNKELLRFLLEEEKKKHKERK